MRPLAGQGGPTRSGAERHGVCPPRFEPRQPPGGGPPVQSCV